MWTSSLLKQNAKDRMKAYYWTGFGINILFTIIAAAASYAANLVPTFFLGVSAGITGGDIENLLDARTGTFWVYYLIVWIIALAVYAFLTSILETGKCRFFYQARNGNSDFGNLFWAFQGGRYLKTAKIMFWRYLEICLWSLALIVPGIIKTYEYQLVPYLLAENPDLSKERAFQISKQTMKDEKWKCFCLQFSFVGWYLLGSILCYVGIFFVIPYYDATMAEFYSCMRAKMLSYGITTEEELNGNNDSFGGFGGGYPQNNNYPNNNYPDNFGQPQSPYQPNPPYPDDSHPTEMPHVNLDKNPYDNNQY